MLQSGGWGGVLERDDTGETIESRGRIWGEGDDLIGEDEELEEIVTGEAGDDDDDDDDVEQVGDGWVSFKGADEAEGLSEGSEEVEHISVVEEFSWRDVRTGILKAWRRVEDDEDDGAENEELVGKRLVVWVSFGGFLDLFGDSILVIVKAWRRIEEDEDDGA